jgi:transcriptional regulator GlxA family with amidase domain
MARHTVAVMLFEGVVAFDAAVPQQVFGHPDERDDYEVIVCSPPGGVETLGGLVLSGAHPWSDALGADTIMVPGIDHPIRPISNALLDVLSLAFRHEIRIVSICTGAFVLAAAGVLDGKRATTHWRDAELLASMYPMVEVDRSALYVDEGKVLTSAGVAAGIDLCLHIVRLDHGAGHANRAARRMIVAPHREGGQAQYIERPVADDPKNGLSDTRAWMLGHLAERLTVSKMASSACMSERSFIRHFHAETGRTPRAWLNDQRVLRAQELLETTTLSVELIAIECGFRSVASLRQHFQRRIRTSPSSYRRAFRSGPQVGGNGTEFGGNGTGRKSLAPEV